VEGHHFTMERDLVRILSQLDLTKLSRQLQNPSLIDRDVQQLLEPARLTSSNCDLQESLQRILHAALVLTRAERGFVALMSIGRKLEYALGQNLQQQPLRADEFDVDEEMIRESLDSQMPVRKPYDDANSNEGEYRLVTPLYIQTDLVGYLHLCGRRPILSPSQVKWYMFQVFLDHAALAIRNNQFYTLRQDWERERETMQESLIASDQMAIKGTMAGKIAHEINNLLSGINANIEIAVDLIREKGKKSTVIERLEKAQEMILNMTALSNGLMNRHGLQTNIEKSSLNAVVNKFVEFVQPIYHRSDVQIVKELDPHLPDARIDQALMIQVIFNIAKNAVEARPDACITLRTRYDRERRRVVLTIEDNGPGMSAEKKSKIFNSLYTDKADGHGYGLAICRDIIEKHKGEIAVESELHKGACFIISLPISRKEDYAELEFDRLEKLEGNSCVSHSSVVRTQKAKGQTKEKSAIEYASLTQ
jgi:signal transduction histidine kinase